MGAHGRGAFTVLLTTLVLAGLSPAAGADFGISDEINALTQIDQQIHGKSNLSPTARASVHSGTAALIASGAYAGQVLGVTYADVLTNLDCVGTSLQHARNAPRSNKALEMQWAKKALGCGQTLFDALKAAGQASPAVLSDIASIGTQIKTIMARISEHHVFGAKSTTLRHFIAGVAKSDFPGLIFSVPFSEHFRAIECIDVKVEADSLHGASACAHRLRRLLKRHLMRDLLRVRAHVASVESNQLVDGLAALDGKLKGSLSASGRSAVHSAKGQLIVTHYTQEANGVRYSDVLQGLDCVDYKLQTARNFKHGSKAKSSASQSLACLDKLNTQLVDGAQAPPALLTDMKSLRGQIVSIQKRIKQRRVFGSKAKAVRLAAAGIVGRYFTATIDGVSLSEHFRDLECIDVKVESGSVSGASSCDHRLARLVKAGAPAKAPITFGSDLTGDAVALPGFYPEDSEFWTSQLAAPVDGTITQFKVKIGSQPIDIPIRFSLVHPIGGGRVTVLSTTNPQYMLPANSPGTYTFSTSTLSFKCCKIAQGDFVTIDNHGADQTPDPYHWFARADLGAPGPRRLRRAGAGHDDPELGRSELGDRVDVPAEAQVGHARRGRDGESLAAAEVEDRQHLVAVERAGPAHLDDAVAPRETAGHAVDPARLGELALGPPRGDPELLVAVFGDIWTVGTGDEEVRRRRRAHPGHPTSAGRHARTLRAARDPWRSCPRRRPGRAPRRSRQRPCAPRGRCGRRGGRSPRVRWVRRS
jgi:hypothetical protein